MIDLLKKINCYKNSETLYDDIRSGLNTNKAVIFSFCNAHAVNLAHKNTEFKKDLLFSDFLLRDGFGVKIAMKMLNMEPGLNLNGTDFIPAFLGQLPKKHIAVLGTEEPWLSAGAKKLSQKHNVIVTLDGFRPASEYIQVSQKYKPSIILLAMGMPKQERIATMLSNALDYPVIIICGGAIIDFEANRFKRAPKWMRRIGLEWFYRLIKEPKRLFKRYIIGNFIFLVTLSYHCILNRNN